MKAAFTLVAAVAVAVLAWLFVPRQPAIDLRIENAVARPLMGRHAAAFMTFQNFGAPDRLLSVSSPEGRAMLHAPPDEAGLAVPVGASSLALDAAHIMVALSPEGLEEGTLVPLTLTFEKAGALNVKARMKGTSDMTGHDAHMSMGSGPTYVVPEGEVAPTVGIDVQPDGSGWQVQIITQAFEFSESQVDQPHVPGVGHGHVYVGGMKLGRVFGSSYEVGALPPGRHEIRVTLNTNDHRTYVIGDAPVSAAAVITVD